jgi:hypothetical protein
MLDARPARQPGDRQQSAKTADVVGPRGCDARKKVKGRKRHILTATDGRLVAAQVHTADIQDRDGAPSLLISIRTPLPWLRHVFPEGGYAKRKLGEALADNGPMGNRDREAIRHHQRVRPAAATLGRRTNLRPARSLSAAGKGFRGLPRQRRGVALRGLDPDLLTVPSPTSSPICRVMSQALNIILCRTSIILVQA